MTDRAFTSEDVSVSAAEAPEKESYIISSCSYAERSASQCHVTATFYSHRKKLTKKKPDFYQENKMFFRGFDD